MLQKPVFLITTSFLSQHYSNLGTVQCSIHATSIGAVGLPKISDRSLGTQGSCAHMLTKCLEMLHGGILAGADPEENATVDERPFIVAQDIIAKDKKDEKKENRRRMHLLECINKGKRRDGKE